MNEPDDSRIQWNLLGLAALAAVAAAVGFIVVPPVVQTVRDNAHVRRLERAHREGEIRD